MRRRARFVYPVPPAPRTAVLIAGFRSTRSVRVFAEGWSERASFFAPQSVAGTIRQIEALKGIAEPTHALVVLRREWEPAISVEDRARLWHAFHVPLFEQIVAEDGTLLAAECEAHCGLHIQSRRFIAGDHEVDRAQCDCGRTSPRLIDLKKVEALNKVAATAR